RARRRLADNRARPPSGGSHLGAGGRARDRGARPPGDRRHRRAVEPDERAAYPRGEANTAITGEAMTYPLPPELLEQLGLEPRDEPDKWPEDHDVLGPGRRVRITAAPHELPNQDRVSAEEVERG